MDVKLDENSNDSLLVTINKTIKGNSREEEIAYVVSEVKYMDDVSAHLKRKKEKPKKKTSKQLKSRFF